METRNHHAYPGNHTYIAIGVIRLADGSLTESKPLFQFKAPDPSDLQDGGLLKIAQSLEVKSLPGFENCGDEHVDSIEY